MRRLVLWLLALTGLGLVVFYLLTAPRTIAASDIPTHEPDLANGKAMFWAGGCVSCHAEVGGPKCDDAKIKDKARLAGGRCLKTPFGTFYVPNISPDKSSGIGAWSRRDFINAMKRGVSPGGAHYYPAFPYTSYQHMRIEDLIDLQAYLKTLPAVASNVPGHQLALPFRLRRGLGLWKLLYLDGREFVPDPAAGAAVNRGGYLVRGPGHCGECHTPRNILGGFVSGKFLAGGPALEGKGWIPNITPHRDGIASWSKADIVYSLETGLKPDFDSFGSTMVDVQENIAMLAAADRKAIAAYLKTVPPVAGAKPKKKKK